MKTLTLNLNGYENDPNGSVTRDNLLEIQRAFVEDFIETGLTVSGAVAGVTSLATSGNVSIGGTLGVTGSTTLSSSLSVTGASVLSSTLSVSGAVSMSSTLGVTGNVYLDGTLMMGVGGTEYAQFQMAKDVSSSDFNSGDVHMMFTCGTDETEGVLIGFECDNLYGFAQTVDIGSAWEHVLALQPKGGEVAIGQTTVTSGAILEVNGISIFKDRVCFTQVDCNEYIDSDSDGDLDLHATSSIGLTVGAAEIAKASTVAFETPFGRRVGAKRLTSADSPYSVLYYEEEYFVDTDGGAVTLNLPVGVNGQHYRIINCGSSGNDVTIVPNGLELLTGSNSSAALGDASVIILTYETTEGWW